MPSDRDALLVARIQAGDASALAAIYDEHAGLVYGLARRVTRDEELARGITQAVFTYLWEMPARVDLSRGSLRTYLAVLAHRHAVDEVRRREARSRAETASGTPGEASGTPGEASGTPGEEDGAESGVADEAARSRRGQRLAQLLGMLPTEQLAAVRLAYYGGFTYIQVANELGIPEETAKSRLRAGLTRLRTLLADEADEAREAIL